MGVLFIVSLPLLDGRKPMDRPRPLNLIRFANEWIVTNGELAADGTIQFPADDLSEEVFVGNGTPSVNKPSVKPPSPPAES
jgi:hypothetical protein